MSQKFPLASSSWDETELAALQRVIDSNYFTMGHEVAQFEKEFAAYFGSKYAVMVNSGSSANLLMTASLRFTSDKRSQLNEGDEIIVPAIGWSTTYFPLSQYGLKLKFVDIDLRTLNYDLGALARAVDIKTRAIMVVNILGNPNDFNAIDKIIGDKEIVLLEDNCESMGAKFDNRYTGTFGLIGSFSSFYSHHISTMEGGILLTNDEEIFHIALALRAHGWTRNLPEKNKVSGTKSNDPFEESWRFVLPGYNLRPTEMSGALGREQLKKLSKIIAQRRANGTILQNMLADHPNFIIQSEIGQSSWFGFSLVLRPEFKSRRSELLKILIGLGFEIRPIVSGNFVKNPVLQMMEYTVSGSLENANYVDQSGLMVGNHHYSLSEAIYILSQIRMT